MEFPRTYTSLPEGARQQTFQKVSHWRFAIYRHVVRNSAYPDRPQNLPLVRDMLAYLFVDATALLILASISSVI
jgi:hypothetical protein